MYERFLNQYHRKSNVLVHSGQDRYVQIIAERAPLYKDIQARKEKTIFTSAIVEKLITDEFIFVQFDKKRNYEYFVYDMDHTEAFKKVREKVVQAIRDLNLDIKRRNMEENGNYKNEKRCSKSKKVCKARASPIKKKTYRNKKDVGQGCQSDGNHIQDFIAKADLLLDEIIKDYKPVVRELSDWENQVWEEALRDAPEIKTDNTTYNENYNLVDDEEEIQSISEKILWEDDTVLEPFYEYAKHDSVITYENYINRYVVPDEEIIDFLDGDADFTSISAEFNLSFEQLPAIPQRLKSEEAVKHEKSSSLDPLEDPVVMNEDGWDQVYTNLIFYVNSKYSY